MTNTNQRSIDRGTDHWTVRQALLLTAACLMAGIAGGWMLRDFKSPARHGSAQTATLSAPAPATPGPVAPSQLSTQPADLARLKAAADAEAAPLLAQLKAAPDNPQLLTSIGDLYYDAQQYPVAIGYYARSLQAQPSDVAVRTDMGTAWWYMGNADSAIAAFNLALTYEPTNPNTLFNLGLVQLQGKHDAASAIANWKKLLAANPDYAGKAQVEQMLAQATAAQHK
jgi:tetratricopeptide (TPR) repeat protein